ncbi:hypothetical protein Moror_5120 [Moniliophthora roreri MCA 2997]|uniref:Uncharacterized protein n=2 Tax=Moniliophthora roreri TaxID=221103 RepID=V2W1K4_MONRO|nr:hypothetical protein Moror_5120 [Moniliophthora roreri MCA 2997]
MLRGTTTLYTYAALTEDPTVILDIHMEQGVMDKDEDEFCDLGPLAGPRDHVSVKLAATKAQGYSSNATQLGRFIGQPKLLEAIRQFLYHEVVDPESETPLDLIPL